MLAAARHSGQDGRDRLDHPQNTVSATQRRGRERVRQTQVRNEVRSPRRRPGTLVRTTLSIHVSLSSAPAEPSLERDVGCWNRLETCTSHPRRPVSRRRVFVRYVNKITVKLRD